MTGDQRLLGHVKKCNKGEVTFGDDQKGEIIGLGNVASKSVNFINDVMLVNNLKYNLISVSQICDNDLGVNFRKDACYIVEPLNNKVIFACKRVKNSYLLKIDDMMHVNNICLSVVDDTNWLWHRRLAHIGMDNLNKLISKKLVRGQT